ncbi:hypothetical protein THRCLA_07334 [Thraustotheca clavata]|uniref:Uncharacterized protein n=1 Tax=Thraustotheca clavata TaxID=74557 RepID=A0A1V9ZEI1_9STRA|nr:hypothetical protein THRCLA_07334 [Thraustotheca clavata]
MAGPFKFSNLRLHYKLDFYQGEGFCGYWFGKELTPEADPIILYTHDCGGFNVGCAQTYLSGFDDILLCLSQKHAPEAKYLTQILEAIAAYELYLMPFQTIRLF